MIHIIGTKIRALREELELTQDELAQSVGLSSEFISLLELGKRDPSLESLSNLARFFKRDLSYFLVSGENDLERLLNKQELSPKISRILKKFKKYCDEYLRLEELAERPLRQAPHYSSLSARKMAAEERRRLGLGHESIPDMCSLAERNGLRIVKAPLPADGGIAGIFIFYESRQAAFSLINSLSSPEKQNFVSAHAYCHYLKDRYDGPIVDTPDMLVEDFVSLYPGREKFAHQFALHFLMPPDRLRDIIDREIRMESLRAGDVFYLRRYFGVELSLLVAYLRQMDFISGRLGTMLLGEEFAEAETGLFGKQLSDQGRKGTGLIYSERYKSLAVSAYQKRRIDLETLAGHLGRRVESIKPLLGTRLFNTK